MYTQYVTIEKRAKGRWQMAKNSSLHVRVDSKLKSDAEKLFSDIGLNTSAAITIFLKQAVNKGGLPFKLESTNDVKK